ncbi:hypothetical protein FPSE5266_20332 [Fusarium pseudograminearum]|nr:hypothetical protein FPSE5266_20332 [Fusarium pseudograminearum]
MFCTKAKRMRGWPEPITVVGMSCRLPGDAIDTQKLWELTTKGRSAWSKVPTDRWNQEAFHDPTAEGKPGRSSFEVGEEDDMFFALVASDNGRGIASMLRDYPWMFGFKAIVGALIVPNNNNPSICWKLKQVMTDVIPDVVPDTPDPPISPFASKKEKRKLAKRMSQSLSEG